MKNIKEIVLNFLFPKTCIKCQKTGEYLCIDCKKTLTPHPEICPYCHKISQNYQTCLDCKMCRQNALEGIIIPFSYTDLIKNLILRFKYKHQKDLADFLVKRLVSILQANQKFYQSWKFQNSTIISYIPSHRYRKYFVKWYNQSQVLAQRISNEIQVPLIDILYKSEASKAQARLQRNQRLVNLKGKFWLIPTIQLQGNETIILIDDITTTNTTLNEAALTIKNQYPHVKIRGLVIARHN